MTRFGRALAERRPESESGRRWLYVPYDQLGGAVGPLAREDPATLGIVLVESRAKAARRPYHRQKLWLVLASQRHFALEQAARGVAVRYVATAGGYADALSPLARELGPLRVQRPAERELRAELAPLVRAGALEIVPHEGWLTTAEDFAHAGPPEGPWRMDAFYRAVRRRTGLLMDGGSPEGGRFSHDGDNRRSWRGDPPAPEPPRFPVDPIAEEVAELVARDFADHPGRLDPGALPVTAADCARQWEWAKAECLPAFGPYEDAMSERSRGLFHTRVAPLLNLGRLSAERLVREAVAIDAPLASREGFVRQLLGWREFVRHVHEATDGFRAAPGAAPPVDDPPGGAPPAPPDALDASRPLPPAWWGTASGMRCLDETVRTVWEDGWSHHVTRLMVLSNLATLLDVSPRALADWFWVAYVDAYDWVVEPNVLAMGTFAVGDLLTTKPYVAGSAYLNRMSDHCRECAFRPADDCPIRRLYWAFLDRKADRLADNLRVRPALRSLARRSAAERRRDRETFEAVSAALAAGERVDGGALESGSRGSPPPAVS